MSGVYNIIIAVSNLVLLLLIGNNHSKYKYLSLLPMMASFIYHLAETKHNLPGIYPLNQYHNLLLNIDRFFAVGSGLLIINIIYSKPNILNTKILSIGILGFLSLINSERDNIGIPISKLEFTITHCIWHFAAFYGLNYCLNYI